MARLAAAGRGWPRLAAAGGGGARVPRVTYGRRSLFSSRLIENLEEIFMVRYKFIVDVIREFTIRCGRGGSRPTMLSDLTLITDDRARLPSFPTRNLRVE